LRRAYDYWQNQPGCLHCIMTSPWSSKSDID